MVVGQWRRQLWKDFVALHNSCSVEILDDTNFMRVLEPRLGIVLFGGPPRGKRGHRTFLERAPMHP